MHYVKDELVVGIFLSDPLLQIVVVFEVLISLLVKRNWRKHCFHYEQLSLNDIVFVCRVINEGCTLFCEEVLLLNVC